MHWIFALLGALLGISLGASSSTLLGCVLGAMLGWQISRNTDLRQRLTKLEQEQRQLSTRQMIADGLATAAKVKAKAANDLPSTPVSSDIPAVHTTPSTPAPTPKVEAVPAASESTYVEPVSVESASVEPAYVAPVQVQPEAPVQRPARARTPEIAIRDSGTRLDYTPSAPSPAAARSHRQTAADRPAFVETARRWLFEGNPMVKLGVLLLFFGTAAALRYASEAWDLSFPIELRLGAIASLALLGLIWGWRNRIVRPAFGLSVQGGAIGVLLLTVFTAYRYYNLLPPTLAFSLVVILVAGAAILALAQNAVSLAVLGFVGGYLGPVLISTGSGNHVALFSYYAVLNAAVFFIAWVRPWRALNLVGFGFTFVIGTMWGAKYYRPELFSSVEPFLILFFLFYVAIAVLHALRNDEGRQGLVDGTLVFGTPLLAFPLQAALLEGNREGLAISALAVAVLYALLAFWLLRSRRIVLLGQSFAALALGFATLAVPLATSARWTSIAWAVEGAALVWLGLRQHRVLPQLAGWILQMLAAAAYFGSLFDQGWSAVGGEIAVFNGHALGVLLMAASALLISRLYESREGQRSLVWIAFFWGLCWWLLAGVREIVEHFGEHAPGLTIALFAALSIVLFTLLRDLTRWPRLGWAVIGWLLAGPALSALAHVDIGDTAFTARHLGWLAWLASGLFALWRLRQPLQRGIGFSHIALLVSVALFYGLTLHDSAQTHALADAWRFVAIWLPLLILLLATLYVPRVATLPLADLFPRYAKIWFTLALFGLGLAWLQALTEPGNSAPLAYVPILNPLELFQLILLLLGIHAARRHPETRPLIAVLIGAGLLFASFAALRGVHQLSGAPWSPELLDNRIAQASLTLVWIISGVAAWIIGSRRQHWPTWVVGAALVGVVLIKLLLVDRRYFGDLAGIISFMAVGGLLVLVGRIAPTPPRRSADAHGDAA